MAVEILVGDAVQRLRELPAESVHCCVTSPPYWGLRSYRGDPGMIGLEPTFDEHLSRLVEVFREVRRALRRDGTLWLNYGDAYSMASAPGPRPAARWPKRNGQALSVAKPTRRTKPKDLMLMPARVALALQADGWWVRSEIVWHKPNPMPESANDRPTNAHEKVYLLTKSATYFYDAEAVRVPHLRPEVNGADWRQEDNRSEKSHARFTMGKREYHPAGANLRNVWTIATESFREAHFATFATKLVEPCLKAGTSERGCCSSCGAPWVREVAVADPAGRLGASYHDHEDDIGRGQRGVPPSNGAPVRRTTGWRPSCGCSTDVEPCVVLDPFAGAGTVGVVAQRLGRHATLIEISPEYAEMARRRIDDETRESARWRIAPDSMPLFAAEAAR